MKREKRILSVVNSMHYYFKLMEAFSVPLIKTEIREKNEMLPPVDAIRIPSNWKVLFYLNKSQYPDKGQPYNIQTKILPDEWLMFSFTSVGTFYRAVLLLLQTQAALSVVPVSLCSHKWSGSESVAVRRYLMLVVWWWLNTWACLWRMVLTLAGRICSDCFLFLMVLFVSSLFLFYRCWKLCIKGD